MTKFSWAAWGLLAVVLDLPLYGWDVVPDLVGYVWLVIGLTGAAAVHPAFVRARAASMVGVPVSVVTGTPFFLGERWGAVLFGALVIGIAVFVVVVHQLLTGLLAVAPAGEDETLRWAAPLRRAVPAVGVLLVVGVVSIGRALEILYPVGFLAQVVVGLLAVVMLHRVSRAGWMETVTGQQNAPTARPGRSAG